jgi:hypothetical protein
LAERHQIQADVRTKLQHLLDVVGSAEDFAEKSNVRGNPRRPPVAIDVFVSEIAGSESFLLCGMCHVAFLLGSFR